jgi:hypothetical protein
MTEGKPPQRDGSRTLLYVAIGVAAVLMMALIGGAALFFLYQQKKTPIAAAPTAPIAVEVEKLPEPEDYALSNSVTIVLGENEERHGLKHIANQKDGATVVQSFEGVSARALSRGTGPFLFFYFQIDPSFKQNDVGLVRFEVEYLLAPQPGIAGLRTMDIQYDSGVAGDSGKYRDTSLIRLKDSNGWQTATFRTRGDAAFSNRQNGGADFRIRARAPLLFVRRVTVTRESLDEKWNTQFSSSNEVSVLLGEEKPEHEGLRFVMEAGPASIEVVEGKLCRDLDRLSDGRMYGSLYFAISPSFKRDGLTNARVDVEYFARKDTAFRLQFDGMDGDTHRMYQPLLPEGARVMRFGTGADYATVPTPGVWSVATFHITNGLFMNSQRNGADFRLEVVPPKIYVRRVTVSRETAKR